MVSGLSGDTSTLKSLAMFCNVNTPLSKLSSISDYNSIVCKKSVYFLQQNQLDALISQIDL